MLKFAAFPGEKLRVPCLKLDVSCSPEQPIRLVRSRVDDLLEDVGQRLKLISVQCGLPVLAANESAAYFDAVAGDTQSDDQAGPSFSGRSGHGVCVWRRVRGGHLRHD